MSIPSRKAVLLSGRTAISEIDTSRQVLECRSAQLEIFSPACRSAPAWIDYVAEERRSKDGKGKECNTAGSPQCDAAPDSGRRGGHDRMVQARVRCRGDGPGGRA